MCVIVLLFQLDPDLPLIVAANRDEYYARRSLGPSVLDDSPRIAGGRDAERGGTWMGFTRAGFFVGLTNQRTIGPPEPARRSRGELVMSALRAGTVAAVERYLAGIDPAQFNAFSLVFGDASELRVAGAGAGAVSVAALGPGLHVLGNDPFGTPSPKVRRAEELATPIARAIAEGVPEGGSWTATKPALERLLGDHELPPVGAIPAPPPWMDRELAQRLQALCVHTPLYGTRSATVAALGGAGVAHYEFADGPPCTTPFQDVTRLLADS